MTKNAELKLSVLLWLDNGMNGEMPLSLIEALHEDVEGFDKRIVRNIAMHSVLIDGEGNVVQDWHEIKRQWRYDGFRLGESTKCEACGKEGLVEHCLLTNIISQRQIIVGNQCVLRYIDTAIDGEDDESKRRFIKRQRRDAQNEHKRQDFIVRFPEFWSDLSRYESFLSETRPAFLASLTKRMLKHGFLSRSLESDWIHFMKNARDLLAEHERGIESKIMRQNALRERQNRIALHRQEELKRMRESRREIAKNIQRDLPSLKEFGSEDEIASIETEVEFMLAGGLPTRKLVSLYEEFALRKHIHENGSDQHDEDQQWLHALDPGRLTKAERTFRYICLAKARLSMADKSAIRRMRIRYD